MIFFKVKLRFSSLVQDLYERHFKFLDADIKSLAASINENFCSDKKIMICHCCTSNGHGYFTVSSEDKKVVVSLDNYSDEVNMYNSRLAYNSNFFDYYNGNL